MTEIRSTSLVTGSKGSLGKLNLELWEWPGGSVFEVSTKVAQGAGQANYAELMKFAKKKGLSVSKEQRPKTTTVLRQAAAAKGS